MVTEPMSIERRIMELCIKRSAEVKTVRQLSKGINRYETGLNLEKSQLQ